MHTALLIVSLLFQAKFTSAARGPRLNPLQGAGSIANFGSQLSNNRKPTSISAPSLSIPSGSAPITPPPQTAASSILAAPSSAWDPAGKDLAEELSDLFLGSDSSSSSSSSSAAASSGANTASCDDLCTTCASALETFSLCASASGDAFVSGDADVVATCLCNDWIADAQTYSWVGPQFDAPYASCVQHVRTEAGVASDVVSSWSAMDGFCSKVSVSWWAQRAMMQTTTMPVETAGSTAAPTNKGSEGLEVEGALVSGVFETSR
ncbi:hypothetical protein DIS24_g11712 [Lasiodiplodia hormozganensis]|uniref:Uncharacterized protein n=1 Tax=Lasiodiplodia hormozganensis TaxID=869390 RepID=A0AA39WHL3_9PEZI|nr:hypothetical protein DIS24_g11712 [Lasiodiplodia hormozganensis]